MLVFTGLANGQGNMSLQHCYGNPCRMATWHGSGFRAGCERGLGLRTCNLGQRLGYAVGDFVRFLVLSQLVICEKVECKSWKRMTCPGIIDDSYPQIM